MKIMTFLYEENNYTSKNEATYFKSKSSQYGYYHETTTVVKVGCGAENNPKNKHRTFLFQRLKLFIYEAFFPEGYPASVSDDYLEYQTWDTIQAFASSISGSLATKAVLEGVGVGDGNATTLAATITWLLRQGAGMVGQILFTWIQGSDLDHNCKRWRLFADILNDSAMCLELSGPLWPPFITQIILCFASVGRSLVGVAGGATRTAITQHQAKSGNISDVAAKDGSQETLVNLVALIVNLIILPHVSENLALTWILFLGLTILHLYANFKAVSSLCFETLNKDRLLLAVQSYELNQAKRVECPKFINQKENVFIGLGLSERDLFQSLGIPETNVHINLGVSLETVMNTNSDRLSMDINLVKKVHDDLSENKFAVLPPHNSRKHKEYNIILGKGFEGKDLLHAYFVAYRMASKPLSLNYNETSTSHLQESILFQQKLTAAGWKIGHLQLSTLGFTGSFVDYEGSQH